MPLNPTDVDTAYPFRFYADGAEDWFEAQVYEVHFEALPDSDSRASLARLWYEHHPKAIDSWMWSGAFASFRVEASNFGAGYSVASTFLRKAHAIAPIADAVALGARGRTTGPWTRWSEQQQQRPDPGPPQEGETERDDIADVWWCRALDPQLASFARDAAFDAALGDAKGGEAMLALRTAVDKLKDVTLRAVDAPAKPASSPEWLVFLERNVIAEDKVRYSARQGTILATVCDVPDANGRKCRALLVAYDGRDQRFEFPETPFGRLGPVCLDAKGARVFVTYVYDILQIDLATQTTSTVWSKPRGEYNLNGLACCGTGDDRFLVVTTSHTLSTFEIATHGLVERSQKKLKEGYPYPLLGGDGVLVAAQSGVTVFVAADFELKSVASLPKATCRLVDGEQEPIVVQQWGVGHFALDGLAALVRTKTKTKTKAKKASRTTAAAKVELRGIPAPEGSQDRPALDQGCYFVGRSARGDVFMKPRLGAKSPFGGHVVDGYELWLRDAGEGDRQLLDGRIEKATLSASKRCAFVTNQGTVRWLSLDGDAQEPVSFQELNVHANGHIQGLAATDDTLVVVREHELFWFGRSEGTFALVATGPAQTAVPPTLPACVGAAVLVPVGTALDVYVHRDGRIDRVASVKGAVTTITFNGEGALIAADHATGGSYEVLHVQGVVDAHLAKLDRTSSPKREVLFPIHADLPQPPMEPLGEGERTVAQSRVGARIITKTVNQKHQQHYMNPAGARHRLDGVNAFPSFVEKGVLFENEETLLVAAVLSVQRHYIDGSAPPLEVLRLSHAIGALAGLADGGVVVATSKELVVIQPDTSGGWEVRCRKAIKNVRTAQSVPDTDLLIASSPTSTHLLRLGTTIETLWTNNSPVVRPFIDNTDGRTRVFSQPGRCYELRGLEPTESVSPALRWKGGDIHG